MTQTPNIPIFENDVRFEQQEEIDNADLLSHDIKIKKNTIIMLMRNLDISEGVCRGIPFIVTEFLNNIIKANIITGEESGKEVEISRVVAITEEICSYKRKDWA